MKNESTRNLPNRDQMVKAFISRDVAYQGVFFTGVRSTRIFCRIGCPAKTPGIHQLEFFANPKDAMAAGFRPCKRCRPIEVIGAVPDWLDQLVKAVDGAPEIRWSDADIRALKLEPDRVRRWFQKHRGMTFHAYARTRRLSMALSEIQEGSNVVDAAFKNGYDSLSGFNEAFRGIFGANPKRAQSSVIMHTAHIQTALGPMVACATDQALCVLEFADRPMLATQIKRVRQHVGCLYVPSGNRIIDNVASQLDAYFAGRLRQFNVPLLTPGSAFQMSVWEGLKKIPFGETRSYAQMATCVGRPEAVRAVGKANGDNRIAIIIPCHRVIGSNGNLTGYGGGLWRKKRLLVIEEADH
jgi:AraC family transcriptional regulator of adaptative response/methylated-DNA-[protein]-cysteine methyltransferase